jgi:SAM-dependent methyltransferase
MKKKYIEAIVKHYETCLEKHGDNHLGVDWPKEEDVYKRYQIMLDVIVSEKDDTKVSLLDFGCGTAHLLQYIYDQQINGVEYSGLDVSDKFVAMCRKKFPNTSFYNFDILDPGVKMPKFDYIIMNGVFTEKRELKFEEMWDYFCKMLLQVFSFAKKGIAFNVMSKAVDWEREDLFHVSADLLINFLTKNLTREFIIRNDYGLFEFTTYVYKK